MVNNWAIFREGMVASIGERAVSKKNSYNDNILELLSQKIWA